MSDVNGKEFVDGLFVKAPRDQAPDFVKASIAINRKSLTTWLEKKQEDWLNLDVKESKNGQWYAEVNTWKPNKDAAMAKNSDDNFKLSVDSAMTTDDIPF